MSKDEASWINKEFVRRSIQNCEEDDGSVEVISYQNSSVVPPGNNYGSCLRRVQAEYLDKRNPGHGVKSISLVIKSPLTSGHVKAIFEEFEDVEYTFYSKFVPLALKFLPNYYFAPKTYFSSIVNVTVLEDLKASGYVMADRCKQLDFDHCRLYTTSSATLHAVSVAVQKEQPRLVESLGAEKLFSNELKSVEPFKHVMVNAVSQLADEMDKIEEYRHYAKVIHSAPASVWDMAVDSHKRRSSDLNALQQGDPWTTNMMFKYDGAGKVVDIRLLDFQMLLYSSPLNDLVFFIWTSANNDVRDSRLEDLYHLYCETFNSKLEESGCSERLSYEDLLENIKLLSPVALIVSAACLPFMVNEKPVEFETMVRKLNSGEMRVYNDYYNKEYCEDVLPGLLRQLKSQGVFDYIESKVVNN